MVRVVWPAVAVSEAACRGRRRCVGRPVVSLYEDPDGPTVDDDPQPTGWVWRLAAVLLLAVVGIACMLSARVGGMP